VSVAEDTEDLRSSYANLSAQGTTDLTSVPVAPTSPEPGSGSAGDNKRRNDRLEMSAFAQVAWVAMVVLAALALSVVVELVFVSRLQHRVAQQSAFDGLRKELAEGTAPVGQTGPSGRLLALGSPVAIIDIPRIHVHQVVLEGSTSSVLMSGPGHRRDTPLPGQAGTSVILGRAAAYGGPFGGLHRLRVGDKVTVTTGQGVSTFKIIDLRRAGDLVPPALGSAKGRLVLVTATGPPYIPSGVLRVDADLASKTLATPPLVLSSSSLPHSEQPLGTDTSTMWALVLWLEALIVVALGIVWSWTRWGRFQTWIVFVPVTAVVGFYLADQFMRLVPNLL
jgi:sortase A